MDNIQLKCPSDLINKMDLFNQISSNIRLLGYSGLLATSLSGHLLDYKYKVGLCLAYFNVFHCVVGLQTVEQCSGPQIHHTFACQFSILESSGKASEDDQCL